MSVQVSDFKYIPGENDAEYIKLLQEHIERQDAIIRKAIAKLKMGRREIGKWIDETVTTGTTSGATTIIRQYRCSVCGGLFGRSTDNYCYNCGARMEGEDVCTR